MRPAEDRDCRPPACAAAPQDRPGHRHRVDGHEPGVCAGDHPVRTQPGRRGRASGSGRMGRQAGAGGAAGKAWRAAAADAGHPAGAAGSAGPARAGDSGIYRPLRGGPGVGAEWFGRSAGGESSFPESTRNPGAAQSCATRKSRATSAASLARLWRSAAPRAASAITHCAASPPSSASVSWCDVVRWAWRRRRPRAVRVSRAAAVAHPQPRVQYRQGITVAAHRGRTDGMENGGAMSPASGPGPRRALELRARPHSRGVGRHRGLRHDAAGDAQRMAALRSSGVLR